MKPSRLLVLSGPKPISRDVGLPVRLRCPRIYRNSQLLVTPPFVLAPTCKYSPPPSAYLPRLSIVSTNFVLSKLGARGILDPQPYPQINAGVGWAPADEPRHYFQETPVNNSLS